MIFYKNFIGVYDSDDKGGLIGYITEISNVVNFTGKDIKELMDKFCISVDVYIESQRIVEQEQ